MEKSNVIKEKSFSFAVRIVKLFKHIVKNKIEYTLSRQLLRARTSIGANVEEAIGGQSGKDFIAKFYIAYKECRETHYWLRLLKDTEFITEPEFASIIKDCEELLKIISSILITSKKKLKIKNS
jgi:four helix bundle protein